uniref:twin-arginine translocation signal domain-containing protein n=1 Tax=Faecalibacterium prausnitzii TaxID=853 RepID=UPI004025573F
MSLEFNRRSFLKYSAAAAVAVAGSSLLVGCGEDEYQKTGKIGSTLKLMGAFTLESASLDSAFTTTAAENKTLTCKFNLKGTSKYGLNILPTNFQVEVTPKGGDTAKTYHALNTGSSIFTLSNSDNYLEKDETLPTTLTVTNISVADGDTIQVKFWPRPQASEGTQAYTRAFCTWKMTVDSTATGTFLK